jgi:hypothetical protein
VRGATKGDRPAPLSPDASMSVKRVEWVRAWTLLSPGAAFGDRPASLPPPLFWLLAKLAELWPTEACLPGRARGGKFPEEISDEGAPQGHFPHRRPRRNGGARRAGAGTYNPSGQQPKRRRQDRARDGGALRSRHWPHSWPRQRTPILIFGPLGWGHEQHQKSNAHLVAGGSCFLSHRRIHRTEFQRDLVLRRFGSHPASRGNHFRGSCGFVPPRIRHVAQHGTPTLAVDAN